MNRKELESFFTSMDFSICFIEETKDSVTSVADGEQLFHTFRIIAQRIN